MFATLRSRFAVLAGIAAAAAIMLATNTMASAGQNQPAASVAVEQHSAAPVPANRARPISMMDGMGWG